MRRMARLIASCMVFALTVAACGGDEGTEPSARLPRAVKRPRV